jgi:hypothetical protein
MKTACPRLFEAEALRDGRLAGAELASFERHLSLCVHCSAEVQALQALGHALRSSHPEDADELHVRRERTRLLAAFDAQLVPSGRSHGRRNQALALAVALAACVGIFAYFRGPTPPPEVSTVTAVVVHADSTAEWSRKLEGSLEKIFLEQGALSIRVEPIPGRRRLLVIVPDGEIEDIGTRFTVSTDAGRTTRVSVQSGSVVLRLNGQPPLALGSGETWAPPPRATAVQCTSCDPAPVPSLGSAPALPSAAVRARRAPVSSSTAQAHASPPTQASDAAPKSDASRDFRVAMSALDRGDNASAAARFATFLAAHPADARAEDADVGDHRGGSWWSR